MLPCTLYVCSFVAKNMRQLQARQRCIYFLQFRVCVNYTPVAWFNFLHLYLYFSQYHIFLRLTHICGQVFVLHSLENGYTIGLSSICRQQKVRSRLCKKIVQHYRLLICAEKLAYFLSVVEKMHIKTFCNADILEIHREFPPQTVVQKIQKYHISAQSPERKGKKQTFYGLLFRSKVHKSSGFSIKVFDD